MPRCARYARRCEGWCWSTIALLLWRLDAPAPPLRRRPAQLVNLPLPLPVLAPTRHLTPLPALHCCADAVRTIGVLRVENNQLHQLNKFLEVRSLPCIAHCLALLIALH